jgi:hypothetical protein
MVEYVPAYGGYWRGCVPGVVAQEILRGTWASLVMEHTPPFHPAVGALCGITVYSLTHDNVRLLILHPRYVGFFGEIPEDETLMFDIQVKRVV